MPRNPKRKSTAGAADAALANSDTPTAAPVTTAELERIRQTPEVNAAVTTLEPYAKNILGIVKAFRITNTIEQHAMADLLRQIKTAIKTVDERFDPIVKPMWQAYQAATTWRRNVKEPLLAAEIEAKEKLGAWELEQTRAQRERERLEREAAELARRSREELERAAVTAIEQQRREAVFTGAGNVEYVAAPVVTAPTQWHSIQPPNLTPTGSVPLAGVSTRVVWTVEVLDEPQAASALIAAGWYDLRAMGVPGPFIRLDVSALKMAVRMEGDLGTQIREALARVPGIRVTETTTTTARGYE